MEWQISSRPERGQETNMESRGQTHRDTVEQQNRQEEWGQETNAKRLEGRT